MKQHLFMIGEGTDGQLLVMTRVRMKNIIKTLVTIDNEWEEAHDFAYLALTGQMTYKMTGQTIEGGGSKQGGQNGNGN